MWSVYLWTDYELVLWLEAKARGMNWNLKYVQAGNYENLPWIFQVWMCGGILLIATCSHVGHVFRSFTPFTWPGGLLGGFLILNRNTIRVVETWLDEKYQEFFYKANTGQRSEEELRKLHYLGGFCCMYRTLNGSWYFLFLHDILILYCCCHIYIAHFYCFMTVYDSLPYSVLFCMWVLLSLH